MPQLDFKLTEVESWPECVELLIEGVVAGAATEVFHDALDRAVDEDHPYVIVDFDRCPFIDVVAAKLLVIADAHLSSQKAELRIYGATAQVRRRLEAIEAFDSRVLLTAAAS